MRDIEIEETEPGTCLVFRVLDLSDDLKELIRSNLTFICLGEDKTKKNATCYSYKATLREFLVRYRAKSPATKKGMIGELLTHLLLLHRKSDFRPVTPFFNLEERSIKKGFDLVLLEVSTSEMWITEVKSGERGNSSSSEKNIELLRTAKTDLQTRLKNSSGLWHNAINHATVAMSESTTKKKILEYLQEQLQNTQDSDPSQSEYCAVLVSVVYGDVGDSISLEDVAEVHAAIQLQQTFKKLILASFQKGTFQKIEAFLEAEAR